MMNVLILCLYQSILESIVLLKSFLYAVSHALLFGLGVENGFGVENGSFIGDCISINLFEFI